MRTDARDKRGPRPVQFLSLRLDPLAEPVAAWVREQRRAPSWRARPRPDRSRHDHDHHHHRHDQPLAGALRLRVERRGGRSVLVEAAGHVPYAARAAGAAGLGARRARADDRRAARRRPDRDRGRRGARTPRSRSSGTRRRSRFRPPSRPATRFALGVGAGARLAWLPEPLILARRLRPRGVARARARGRRGGAHSRARRARPPRRGAGPLPRRSLRCELDGRPLLHDAVEIDGGTRIAGGARRRARVRVARAAGLRPGCRARRRRAPPRRPGLPPAGARGDAAAGSQAPSRRITPPRPAPPAGSRRCGSCGSATSRPCAAPAARGRRRSARRRSTRSPKRVPGAPHG